MNRVLRVHAGDWVEVRSAEEILATLDTRGHLDALPFMPEMLQYCGKKFRVFKSAHKTCDTIESYQNRKLTNSVHLEGLRCNGEAHGGCQAGCLLFWKEAWLKPASRPDLENRPQEVSSAEARGVVGGAVPRLAFQVLVDSTRVPPVKGQEGDERYSCQATELLRATTTLHWWDLRQYAKDLVSRNVRLRDLLWYGAIAAFNMVVRRLNWRLRTYPYMPGPVAGKTPNEVLNLQAGELVQVRSKREIMRTINANRHNRGLSFDVEMVPFCGKTFRVLRRVDRIIDEKTGRMLHIQGDCLILSGVTCGGCLSRNRLFCPRSIYPYWREIWLKRVE
jgi:hypothetical protein